jgi:3-dehydroquinate synthetase
MATSRSTVSGIPLRNAAIPLIETAAWDDDTVAALVSSAVRDEREVFPLHLLHDKEVENSPDVAAMKRACGWSLAVDGGEAAKSPEALFRLLEVLLDAMPRPQGTIVAVGGGTLLNVANLVAALLHRGTRFVAVPTTVMSMADVAVGSKAMVNFGGRKNVIGVYNNPTAIVLCRRFLETLPEAQRLEGLSECLKHALLQDADLFHEIAASGGAMATGRLFEVAKTTALLKSAALAADPFEIGAARRVLHYGHLHAHSMERATGFALSHGFAVYWGVLVELAVADSPVFPAAAALVRGLPSVRSALAAAFDGIDEATLRAACNTDNKVQHVLGPDAFTFVGVPAIGTCGDVGTCSWGEVWSACRKAASHIA